MNKLVIAGLIALMPFATSGAPVAAPQTGHAHPASTTSAVATPTVVQAPSRSTAVEARAINRQLEAWRKAWSRDATRRQDTGFAGVYVAGEAMQAVARSSGFAGRDLEVERVERIAVTGDVGASSVLVREIGADGEPGAVQRILHVWRKVGGNWRIELETTQPLAMPL